MAAPVEALLHAARDETSVIVIGSWVQKSASSDSDMRGVLCALGDLLVNGCDIEQAKFGRANIVCVCVCVCVYVCVHVCVRMSR